MVAGTRTLGLHETLLEPRALPPPPTRHALFAFVLALAALIHIGTAGWGGIHDGAEGYFAGSARQVLEHHAAFPSNEPPLLTWLLLGSFRTFGVSAMSARLPTALATVAAVAFTFLIGERLAGFWRGFVAALIHLCSLGMFVAGRLVTPDPLCAAFLGGALFCAVSGYQRPRERPRWFAGVAIFAGLICLTRGLTGLACLLGILFLLALIFREARLRFRMLLHWPYLLIFVAIVLPWPLCLQIRGATAPWHWLLPAFAQSNEIGGVGLGQFLLLHLAWWYPGLFLVLPGLCFAARKIFRPHEFDFAEALPLVWMAIGFLPLLFFSGREDHHSISMWSALALWIASAWERTPRRWRIAGAILAALVLLVGIGGAATGALASALPENVWRQLRWLLVFMGLLAVIALAACVYFAAKERDTVAITILFLAMAPIGLGLAEAIVQLDSNVSLANAATFLERHLGEKGEVLFEGPPRSGSSLRFYLDRPVTLVAPDAALQHFAADRPVYLIVDKTRVAFWQEFLTQRFHIFHQETTCGRHVVISNQP
ncbi:MAG: glycosyltransferase family 39 protein [Verrucomicrobiota bacterium]|nr:glycosyltransferase family 39 protein [Verrucomicrobiota bacterium]